MLTAKPWANKLNQANIHGNAVANGRCRAISSRPATSWKFRAPIAALLFLACSAARADDAILNQPVIDRHALVARHKVVRTSCDQNNPVQVGNGRFAFSADITGLQTFTSFNTMSEWGWHTAELPRGAKLEDFTGGVWDTHGRPVAYDAPETGKKALSRWLFDNPRRLNLGRIGLELTRADGKPAGLADLSDPRQELDMWTGILKSSFAIDGVPVQVETCCHPTLDAVAVRIVSKLVANGQLKAFIDFPYAARSEFANLVGDWSSAERHQTPFTLAANRLAIQHKMDATSYFVTVAGQPGLVFQPPAPVPPAAPLVIVSARYGAKDRFVDVTAKLTAAVTDNRLEIAVNNALGGSDPFVGAVKKLHVRYTISGQPFEEQIAEGGTLAIGGHSCAHRFKWSAASGDRLEFTCVFAPDSAPGVIPSVNETQAASTASWARFWQSGGAIDLSQSKDPRWRELERRIVLSQYLLAVNEAGTMPPQESGLVNNGWNGKFHLEMFWWHAAHYALWNRWDILDRSLGIYQKFLPSACERARRQGFKGARWPKMTSSDGRESPHPCNALLIWQQPHPIFFAELDYRAHPSRDTLKKWRQIVYDTADFLSSFAYLEPATGQYVLGPPIYVVSENTNPKITTNPAFELAYWRFGLRVAQTWRERLGEPQNPEWEKVFKGLAPLPRQDGVYVLYEGVRDMWTHFNYEHPALTGIFGMLPGDGTDPDTMRRTAEKVFNVWQIDRVWGWDFPMLAMCAGRIGKPDKAVEFLLTDTSRFSFSDVGLATGGPYPYMPSNGGLLYAVAMLAAGWDGAPDRPAPGFPADGSWVVKWEGLHKAP